MTEAEKAIKQVNAGRDGAVGGMNAGHKEGIEPVVGSTPCGMHVFEAAIRTLTMTVVLVGMVPLMVVMIELFVGGGGWCRWW